MGNLDNSGPARLVLAEDQVSFRELLRLNFEHKHGYTVVGETGVGDEVAGLCRELNPTLLILDFFLPGTTGFELIRKLRTEFAQLRILILTGCEHHDIVEGIIKAPVAGYVAKTDSLKMINLAVETVVAGGYFRGAPPYGELKAADAGDDVHLTTREQQVLELVAKGLSTKEISTRLGLSAKTVDHHRTRMMRKLRIHDVVSLTRYALRHGIASLQ